MSRSPVFPGILDAAIKFAWWELAATVLLLAAAEQLAQETNDDETTPTETEAWRTARQPQRPETRLL